MLVTSPSRGALRVRSCRRERETEGRYFNPRGGIGDFDTIHCGVVLDLGVAC